jgi:hypothetical protein
MIGMARLEMQFSKVIADFQLPIAVSRRVQSACFADLGRLCGEKGK